MTLNEFINKTTAYEERQTEWHDDVEFINISLGIPRHEG